MYVPDAQGGLPHVLYVPGSGTSLGRTVRAHRVPWRSPQVSIAGGRDNSEPEQLELRRMPPRTGPRNRAAPALTRCLIPTLTRCPNPNPNPDPDPDPNPNSNEVSATGPRREGARPCAGGRGAGAHSERREHGRALRGLPAAAARHTEGTAAPVQPRTASPTVSSALTPTRNPHQERPYLVVPHRQPPRRIGADILAPERVVAHADEGFRPVKMTPPLQPPPPRCTLRETYLLEITWDDPEDDGGDEVFEWTLPIPP